MQKRYKYPFILIAMFMLLMTLVIVSLPLIIKKGVVDGIQDYTPYNAKINKVHVNFFSGNIFIDQLQLSTSGNQALVIEGVDTKWNWASIFKGEFEVVSFSVDGLKTSVQYDENKDIKVAQKNLKEIAAESKTNSEDVVEDATEIPEEGQTEESKDKNLPPIKINQVVFSDFAIEINEKDRLAIHKFLFTGMDLSQPNKSSQISLDASLNEQQKILIRGDIFPLNLKQKSRLNIKIENLDLQKARTLADKAGVKIPSMKGVLTSDQVMEFSVADVFVANISGSLGLEGFEITQGNSLYKLGKLDLKNKVILDQGQNITLNFSGEKFRLIENKKTSLQFEKISGENLNVILSENIEFQGKKLTVDDFELPSSALKSKNKSVSGSRLMIGKFRGEKVDKEELSTFSFLGQLGEFGKINVSIKEDKVNGTKSTDVDVKSFDMTDLSSLTINQIGYRVEKGKVDAVYHAKVVKNSQVKGKLDLVLLNLQLSDENELEKKITDDQGAPLATLVNMVKDSENKIKLNFPIEGDANSPEFGVRKILGSSFGSFILGQLTSALTNIAVTSYLPMLASSVALSPASVLALGKAGYDFLSKLRFEPIKFKTKNSILSKEGEKQLSIVAKVLKDKPAVILNFCPNADFYEIYPKMKEIEKLSNEQGKRVLSLAEARLKSITNYLIKLNGVNPSQVISCKPKITDNNPAEPQVVIEI